MIKRGLVCTLSDPKFGFSSVLFYTPSGDSSKTTPHYLLIRVTPTNSSQSDNLQV